MPPVREEPTSAGRGTCPSCWSILEAGTFGLRANYGAINRNHFKAVASASVSKVIVPAGFVFSNFFVGIVVVAVLYFAREILVPIALAVLLSFVLAPLVRFLQRLRVPRSLAVMGAVTAALALSLSLATMVMIEVNLLANDLPRYQSTLSDKMHNLRDAVGRAGLLNASSMLKNLDRELKSKEREDGATRPSLSDGPASKTPIPVEVHQPDPGASETLVAMLQPLAAPFTTTAIVVIFLIFFLFQREDLRNRFIRLAGSDDLERTTAALDDAGDRLSKLFLTQLGFKCHLRRHYRTGAGGNRRAQCITVGSVGSDSAVRSLYWRDPGRSSSDCPRSCGRKRLDHGDLDGGAVRYRRTRHGAGRRAASVRTDCRSFPRCYRGSGVVLDVALGPCGFAALHTLDAVSGRSRSPCRTTPVHRHYARRPAGPESATSRLPAHADGRPDRGD